MAVEFQVVVDSKKRPFSWGFGGYGRLGHAEPKDEYIPRLIKFFDGHNRGVEKIFCGSTFTIATGPLGIFLWGQTRRSGEANMYPKPLQDLCGWDIRSVGCSYTSVVVAAEESVIAWGPSPTYGELVSFFIFHFSIQLNIPIVYQLFFVSQNSITIASILQILLVTTEIKIS